VTKVVAWMLSDKNNYDRGEQMKIRNLSRKFSCTYMAVILIGTFFLGSVKPVHAEFPNKPVEMTLLFGGTANAIGHLVSDLMGKTLGQPVVAVSRNGAGGAVGYSYVNETDPDGYNMVFNSNSISTAYHRGNLKFDYSAFDAVARVNLEVPVLAAKTQSGWESLEDFREAALNSKQQLKIGISGKGAFTHLASAMLFDSMGIGDKVIYIPYGKGKGPAELLAGRIHAALQWPGQFKSYVDAGKLVILGVTSKERLEIFPDVASAKEQGYDVDITMYRGLAVKKGTPQERILKLQEAVKTVVESQDFKKFAKDLGFEPAYLPAKEFDKVIATQDERIGNVIKELNLKR